MNFHRQVSGTPHHGIEGGGSRPDSINRGSGVGGEMAGTREV